jgi:hypothetical protein
MRLQMSPSLTEIVRSHLSAFLANPPDNLEWQCVTAQQVGALPLYMGWTATIGLRPDGSIVEWNTDEPDLALRAPDDKWAMIALTEGVRTYPDLAPLLPRRPSDAQSCGQCGGTGRVPVIPGGLPCDRCSGLGWTHRDA